MPRALQSLTPAAIAVLFACLGTLTTLAAESPAPLQTVIDFEKDKPGTPPAGFTTALTGSGKPGVWVVVEDQTAASGHQVLAQKLG